ncbi:glycosyltransferase [Streptomyces palmae]|uniref:glycosyltransferase n=1 Tax=Streptomyces palmae TaxID=1701085 RepID=UPI001FD7F8E2|nr:nucleotide disphospho-sugar-binding domain-containing protein [Streptomyces palmae]
MADRAAGRLRARIGAPGCGGDPRFSPYGTIAFTGRALLGDKPLPHDRVRLVGPAVAPGGTGGSDFPRASLAPDRAKVLVSLGTANADAGGPFLAAAVEALNKLADRVQGTVAHPGRLLTGVPPGVLVRGYVPQRALPPHLDAVVCYAGHNTVCESLWHGAPLVLAPIRDDQPIVARLVVDAGAGVRVRFQRVDAAGLRAAVETVRDPAAAGHLEEIAERYVGGRARTRGPGRGG